ncbi:hypothetical protein HDU67_007799 [Dinochytrium kinnereticum]|nr:hypothetical protein HDU67_007799 [Dinochytrium kinnereticum]
MAQPFRVHITTKLSQLTSQPEAKVRPIVERARFTKGARITVSLSAILSSQSNQRRGRGRFSGGLQLDSEDGIQEEEEVEDAEEEELGISRTKAKGNITEEVKDELFRRCKDVSEKWQTDEFVDKVESEGREDHVYLSLAQWRDFRPKVAREGEYFGREELFTSLKAAQASSLDAGADFNLLSTVKPGMDALVEYELPGFGHRFEPSHLRGIFIASFVVRSLRFAKAKARSRCRIRVWSLDTGLVLAEYGISGDKRELEKDPLRYLTILLSRANARISNDDAPINSSRSQSQSSFDSDAMQPLDTEPREETDIERRAQKILSELASGKHSEELRMFKEVFGAWKWAMKLVLEKYGASGDLEVDTSELEDGLLWNDGNEGVVRQMVILPLCGGHPEAPVLKPRSGGKRKSTRRSTISLAGNGDESDPDSIFDELSEDEEEGVGVRGPVNPEAGLSLDLRLGNKFGVASLTHEGGAPTPLAVDVASALIRGGCTGPATSSTGGSLTFVVTSWSRHYRVLLAKRIIELLGYWKNPIPSQLAFSDVSEAVGRRAGWVEVPHGRILGIETDATYPDQDGFSSPFRWVDLACSHLRTISGKSSMVFPDEPELIRAVDIGNGGNGWESRVLAEANYTKVTGRDGVSDEVAAFLANSAIIVQVLQSKRVKDCMFDWGRIVDDKRDVGLYLQYAHARLCGIQRRSGVPVPFSTPGEDGTMVLDDEALAELAKADLSLLARTPSAVDLASVMAQIPVAFGAAATTLDPSAFVPFLVSLARQISSGHNSMFVKGSPENVARARMALLWAARVVISGGLKMLGLSPMQKM